MIAEVTFNLPLERTFHYLVPEPLQAHLQRGMRVLVPFGARTLVGFVLRLLPRSPIRELKAIRRIIDPMPVIGEERWALASWLSSYYYCSLGEALSVMVPSDLRLQNRGSLPPSAPSSPPSGGRGVTLTPHQQRAVGVIRAAVEHQRFETILIHGVTGSGKTELYLQAIDLVLRQDRCAICLVPEIALTPQTIDRFQERFGQGVAVWHSRLTRRQRAEAWLGFASGRSRVAVGTRSAVFLPMPRLGLIILDEEHEQTYKQEDTPRYHAREVAKARAQRLGATVVLGSATPSIESYDEARRRRSRLVTLPERVTGQALPAVEIIDMRQELGRGRRAGPFSSRLRLALEQTVERGEQVMLLLNRRGFARIAQCPACGAIVRCVRCAVPLVYHASRNELLCHYCSFHQVPEEVCGTCRKGYLRFRGMGTERVESALHRLFPTASISRMDADTTARRESHRQLYEALKSHQVSLLVGTQMIAKGHDFPQVTLVGVVSADTALNLPDFRAGERTFSLLTQVAGRSGRGAQPGRVLIQTYCPTHYAIQSARQHDYPGFFAQELRMRKRLTLPPWAHLVQLTLRGGARSRVQTAADALGRSLRRRLPRQRRPTGRGTITLLGPAPHRIPRLRRTYQVCVVLKGPSVEEMVAVLRKTLQSGRRFRGMPVTVDVDPL